ncbi:MAG TPA: hypothetical protein PKJ97_03140, partial [Candidatus Bilamarchaeaceae archaeon]|nr:hypothetical protein [Candidatus Bilamarchaeaceae archaeon]
MRAEARRQDPVEEAAKRGMAVSDSYSIPGRGNIRVATDRHFGEDYEAFARYVYANRHDPGKVRFMNPGAGHTYSSSKEQDKIAEEIARQEDVRVAAPPPPFSEERERAERVPAAIPRRTD